MRPNSALQWTLVAVVVGAFAFVLIGMFFLLPDPPEASSSTSAPETSIQKIQYLINGTVAQPTQASVPSALKNAALPARLKIPKIGVDALIEYVGLTSGGDMSVPKGPSNAAWFEPGPRPGDMGNAVIAGHEGWKDNIPAIFDNLHLLQKGDTVYVEDTQGKTITFMVREIKTYGEHDDASGVFISSDGKAHLNLITCEGIWNAATKSYSGRLVVFADRVL